MTIVSSGRELGRRDRKKLETRAALERAALELVAERGLAGVTVEDISEAADVSSRTFFNYFSCKEEALTGKSPMSDAYVGEAVSSAPSELPVLEVLRRGLREVADHIQAGREQWMLRLRVFEQNPSLLSRLVVNGAETERVMADAVARRIGVDPVANGYPVLVAAVASAAFRVAMMRWSVQSARRELGDLLDEAFDHLAAGLPGPADPSDPGPLRSA
ncbi:TetR/AcrR family transcriptional regulator [Streptosporangium fragile]|uniref:TetR/AcrR family transcriptional regulator n=1 Tax=Streptosporangium fragile TaxID=46186 RepID=UPI0031EB4496